LKFYITTPLYYVNDVPHIGHSYTNTAADTLARYRRLKGDKVFFLTGTDEHGQKVVAEAEKRGKQPGEFVEAIVPRFKELWEKLYISYDDFIRTTEQRHIETVKKVLSTLYEKGDIYKGEYKGWYCVPCETFWPGAESGNPICPDCGRGLEALSEKNYFFKLSGYQGWLLEHIESHPNFILPLTRRNEILSFLKQPLSDLCISRPRSRLSWGIELPFDPDYVTYVWFDALINYISACGYPEGARFKEFWPADVHIIGKDILRPHTVYWPVMLYALGIALPKMVFAHGWWKLGQEKVSKSRGVVVDPAALVEKYGADAYRYFLLREVPFGLDGNYSEEVLINRFNNDLANDLGNLVNRTLTMVEKYYGGRIPLLRGVDAERTGCVSEDVLSLSKALVEKARSLPGRMDRAMEKLDFSGALSSIWELINAANKYIEQCRPWVLAKEDKQSLSAVIYNLLEVLRITAVAVSPFMPRTAVQIAAQLGIKDKFTFSKLTEWGRLKPGAKINKQAPLFPRISPPVI